MPLSKRVLHAHTSAASQSLDYWESGMDLGISRDWFESFVRYQKKLRQEYKKLQKKFGFEIIDANRPISAVQRDLRTRIEAVLASRYNPAP